MKKVPGALCVMLFVSGCASVATLDKTAVVSSEVQSKAKQFVDMTSRVNTIAYHLAVNGASLCSSVEYRNPLLLYSATAAGRGFNAQMLAALYHAYGFDNEVRVFDVADGAPVVSGELHRGDRVVKINDEAVSDDVGSATSALQSAVATGKTFDVVIAQTGGGQRTVRITPAKGCSGMVVAMATLAKTTDVVDYGGDGIALPADLLKYFKTDSQLAFLIARQYYYLDTSASIGRTAAGYTGAAIDGVMRYFTFGLANVFINLSHGGVLLARVAGRSGADIFALKLMKASGYDAHDVPKLWHRIDELPADKKPNNPTLTPSDSRRDAVGQAIEKLSVPVGAQAKASFNAQ